MIKFKVFNLFDTEEKTVDYTNFFGKQSLKTYTVRKYKNTYELYQAIAAFLDLVGDNFVCMTGITKAESSDSFI